MSVDRLDDPHYPAYSIGQAARLLDCRQAFLRSLDVHGLVAPERSDGGHRRYSRHQLEQASRVRDLLDEGFNLMAACRVVVLEDELRKAKAALRKAHAPAERVAQEPPREEPRPGA